MNRRPSYNIRRSYRWNYDHPPSADPVPVPPWPGNWNCCGWPLTAPLAVAAGPLLNGAWLRYYANLGFDLLTYKTVRRRAHPCYSLPNLQPVACLRLDREGKTLSAGPPQDGSWAVSFGMPSPPLDQWESDLRSTRDQLASNKALSVSVVATPDPDWTLSRVADDYAECSQIATTSGADLIELNLSCPNVTSCDGQLYRQPEAARFVACRVRERIGTTPILLKIGHLVDDRDIGGLLDAVAGCVDALVMVNCIAAHVRKGTELLFGGQPRGIAGPAIHEAALRQVARFRRHVERSQRSLQVIGCGGANDRAAVQRFLDAGADCVQLATALMRDPDVALQMRQQAANATP